MNDPVAAQRPRVLVVEDEPGLCELACIWVEALGFDAVGAEAPAEALKVLSAGRFDVLFTDLTMPGPMDGVALAHEACRRQPGLCVVLTSGDLHALLDRPDVPWQVLVKPYTRKDLAQAIERARSGSPAP